MIILKSEILANIGAFALVFITPILLLIGIIMVFYKKYRRRGLYLILGAIALGIIGFSVCAANFSLNFH